MSQDYVDIALCEVQGPTGPIVRLNDIVDLSYDIENNKQAVKTMNRRRLARGFRRGTKMVTGSFTVEKNTVPEFDWRAAQRGDWPLQFFFEENEGGARFHLEDMEIGDISHEYSEEGTAQTKINFVAIDENEQ